MTGAAWLANAPDILLLPLILLTWIGHACLWTASLNNLYGRAIPKWFLRPYRLFCGVVIAAFPAVLAAIWYGLVTEILTIYLLICFIFGAIIFPKITWQRWRRTLPSIVVHSTTETLDLGKLLGSDAVGDGKNRWMARLPFTCPFRVDFTRLTLALPNLPPRWTGLRILLLSDLHFHGTPSRAFFEHVIKHLQQREVDLILIAGDLVDTDQHLAWIQPLLKDLQATQGKYAILGNHDIFHHPEKIRAELTEAGFTLLGNGWQRATIRGEECLLIGHEGPWFAGEADLAHAPAGLFKLLVSHSPDYLPWAKRHGVNLMVSGHVHGGQIRLPIIGSIFVPSRFGRRYDEGVFHEPPTVLVVNRGLSGKEPIRFRCHPQVTELTLLPAERPGAALGESLAGDGDAHSHGTATDRDQRN